MHVLVSDDRGRLALRRLWPWQRILAQRATARLDRALAAGARPEASARPGGPGHAADVHGVPP